MSPRAWRRPFKFYRAEGGGDAGRSRVSTVIWAERPASIGRPGSPSIAIRTGTRCLTFTQLPLAFCAGRTENSLPVPAPPRINRSAIDRDQIADLRVAYKYNSTRFETSTLRQRSTSSAQCAGDRADPHDQC